MSEPIDFDAPGPAIFEARDPVEIRRLRAELQLHAYELIGGSALVLPGQGVFPYLWGTPAQRGVLGAHLAGIMETQHNASVQLRWRMTLALRPHDPSYARLDARWADRACHLALWLRADQHMTTLTLVQQTRQLLVWAAQPPPTPTALRTVPNVLLQFSEAQPEFDVFLDRLIAQEARERRRN